MGTKAGAGCLAGAIAGFVAAGPLGALVGGILGGAVGQASERSDAKEERERKELEKLDPNGSAGEIASTLKRAGRSNFTHTHEREIEVNGERVTEKRTREIRRSRT